MARTLTYGRRVTQLSVIVPFYNVEDYAVHTLRSLQSSARSGTEFLLVDDGSTDSTPAILQAGADRLPGSRVISCGANRGLAAARNLGLRAARGTYIAFLDGDDFVTAGYYPTLLATIQRFGCDLLRTDHVQVRGRERSVHRINHGPRRVVLSPRTAILPVDRITSVDAPYAWAGIYHRRLLDAGLLTFAEDLRTCEDRPWNWRLHLQARSFAVVGLLGVHYRRNIASSLTQLADERQFDFVKAFDQIVAQVQEDRDGARLLPKAVRSYCAVMLHHLGQLERYPPALAVELEGLCRAALRRLPAEPLARVRAGLEPARRDQLTALLATA